MVITERDLSLAVMAQTWMAACGVSDLDKAIKAARAFIRMDGMEIGGSGMKPTVVKGQDYRRLLRGLRILKKLDPIETGRRLPQNSSKVPMPKVKPPKQEVAE